jgi:hypothetical protein
VQRVARLDSTGLPLRGSTAQSTDTESNHDGHRIGAFRIALRSFNSQWFLTPQGSDIVAVTLHQLHYQFSGLGIIANIFWASSSSSRSSDSCCSNSCAQYRFHAMSRVSSPRTLWKQLVCSISIAFTTIIQTIALTLTPSWGSGWGMAAYVMW